METNITRVPRLEVVDALRGFAMALSCWWLEKHKYGPLEYLWRQGMWLGAKK